MAVPGIFCDLNTFIMRARREVVGEEHQRRKKYRGILIGNQYVISGKYHKNITFLSHT